MKLSCFPAPLLFLCTLLLSSTLVAQEVRGLHVNDFKDIIGQPAKERELLEFAQREQFNYLLLYNLHVIDQQFYDLSKAESSQALAQFIKLAKTQYGIHEIGAVGESAKSFEKIEAYNQLYTGSIYFGIDVYHLEFEFWNKKIVEEYYCQTYLKKNGFPCDEAGAFSFYQVQLEAIRQMARKRGLICETYIGTPSKEQCTSIGKIADRVLVHYYRKSDVYINGKSIFQYKDYRLPALANAKNEVQILPIFSAREKHMGDWLGHHMPRQAWLTFVYGKDGYEAQRESWKDQVKLRGYQWYRYTDLRDRLLNPSDPYPEKTHLRNE